jgi:hypothetical protein
VVWAEGEEKERVGGVDRNALEPSPGLAIWTIPASPEELRQALDIVCPQTVYLFASDSAPENTDGFLARLTGLMKYAINHREGRVTYAELAAATSQRLITVEHGLNWLVSRGNITLKRQENDSLWIAPGANINDLGGAARLFAEVKNLLAESDAYRAHFSRAETDSLLP